MLSSRSFDRTKNAIGLSMVPESANSASPFAIQFLEPKQAIEDIFAHQRKPLDTRVHAVKRC